MEAGAMCRFPLLAGVFAAFVVFVLGSQAIGQTRPPAITATPPTNSAAPAAVPAPIVAESADQLLKQMSSYLGSAEQFTFRADVTFDHVLPTGQKLQFTATEDVALRRPNGLYVEWRGDLGNRQFWYDGKAVTIYDPASAFFGSDAAPPEIDGMLDKVATQLKFTPPLTDFLYSDPYKGVRNSIQYGFSFGDTEINGRICRGLAFVEKHIDWQIWIDTGPQRVPCKLVITYKNNSSLPQFSAVFSEWDFAPRIAVSTFTAEMPPGVEAVPFAKAAANNMKQ